MINGLPSTLEEFSEPPRTRVIARNGSAVLPPPWSDDGETVFWRGVQPYNGEVPWFGLELLCKS